MVFIFIILSAKAFFIFIKSGLLFSVLKLRDDFSTQARSPFHAACCGLLSALGRVVILTLLGFGLIIAVWNFLTSAASSHLIRVSFS